MKGAVVTVLTELCVMERSELLEKVAFEGEPSSQEMEL